MIDEPVKKSVRLRWAELLLIALIAAALAGLVMLFVQKSRVVYQRIDCSNNLREVGGAMDRFGVMNGSFPSDNHLHYPGQSFYQQIVDELGISDRLSNGSVNPNAVVGPFVCPGRRRAEDVPGACDYGYLQTNGTSSLSVLDSSYPVSTTVCNGGALQYIPVLSHIWVSPDKYRVAEPRWASREGHSAPGGKDARSCLDTDPTGAGCLGSPHRHGMPTLYQDGHVGLVPYAHPQFQMLWDCSRFSK